MDNKIKLLVSCLLSAGLLAACVVLVSCLLSAGLLPAYVPAKIAEPSPVPTVCTWQIYTNKNLPELANEWRAKLAAASIQVTKASAGCSVEPTVCYQQTPNGYVQVSRTEDCAGAPYFSATIPVKNITDSEALGSLTQKIVEATQSMQNSSFRIQDLNLSLTFRADKDRVLGFYLGEAMDLSSQGLTGAALLNALEKGQ